MSRTQHEPVTFTARQASTDMEEFAGMADDDVPRPMDDSLEEHRRFMRAMSARHERAMERMIDEMVSWSAAFHAEIREERRRIRADTQALLRVLDERLPPRSSET
jgi:hypothetical protein